MYVTLAYNVHRKELITARSSFTVAITVTNWRFYLANKGSLGSSRRHYQFNADSPNSDQVEFYFG